MSNLIHVKFFDEVVCRNRRHGQIDTIRNKLHMYACMCIFM